MPHLTVRETARPLHKRSELRIFGAWLDRVTHFAWSTECIKGPHR